MMKLYYSPGSCALGIHILLEEIGAPFELQRLNFAAREQYGEDYLTLNPKSKVPALQLDDGQVLTEYQAISTYLALTHPEKHLIPADPHDVARMYEALDYVVGTLHAQGFARIARSGNFTPKPEDEPAVKARGQEIFDRGLALIDATVADKDWVAGDFSIADPALFYVCFWKTTRLKQELPVNLAGHFGRMMHRPSVKKALADEGL